MTTTGSSGATARRLGGAIAAVLTTMGAVAATTVSAAPGPKHTVASGVVAHAEGTGFAWQVRVARNDLQGLPGLCLETDHSWDAEGTSFGNVSARCVAGRKGRRFSLQVSRCRGVFPALSTASLGDRTIRKLAFALDRRARKVRLRFPDGTNVTVPARRAPAALGLPVRLAWHVDAGATMPTRVTAVNRRSRVVGRWKEGSPC